MQPQLGAQVVLADAVTVGAGPSGKDSHAHTSCTLPGPTLPGNPWDAPWGGLDSFCRPRVSGGITWGLSFKPARAWTLPSVAAQTAEPLLPTRALCPINLPHSRLGAGEWMPAPKPLGSSRKLRSAAFPTWQRAFAPFLLLCYYRDGGCITTASCSSCVSAALRGHDSKSPWEPSVIKSAIQTDNIIMLHY